VLAGHNKSLHNENFKSPHGHRVLYWVGFVFDASPMIQSFTPNEIQQCGLLAIMLEELNVSLYCRCDYIFNIMVPLMNPSDHWQPIGAWKHGVF
jgi:hypothetical protein